jgi:hypothetical protein
MRPSSLRVAGLWPGEGEGVSRGQVGEFPEVHKTPAQDNCSWFYALFSSASTSDRPTSKRQMAQTARALVAPKAGGKLGLQDVQLDSLRSDEALVEIHAVGICHADISCLSGKLPVKFPNVFGHEGMQRIIHFRLHIVTKLCVQGVA